MGGVATASNVCSKCGAENAPDAVSCTKCGSPILQGFEEVPSSPEEKKQESLEFSEYVEEKGVGTVQLMAKPDDQAKTEGEFTELADEGENSEGTVQLMAKPNDQAKTEGEFTELADEGENSEGTVQLMAKPNDQAKTEGEFTELIDEGEKSAEHIEHAGAETGQPQGYPQIEQPPPLQPPMTPREEIPAPPRPASVEQKPKLASLPAELSKRVDRVMIVSAIFAIVCHFVGAKEMGIDWRLVVVERMPLYFSTFSYEATIRLVLMSIALAWSFLVYRKVKPEMSDMERSNANMVLGGAILVVLGPAFLIPLSALAPGLPVSYYILPWPIFNSIIVIVGIVIIGAYVLWSKEESGGYFTFLLGVLILFILPVHKMFHIAPLEWWQLLTYDQIIGAIGEGMIAISFVMVRRRRSQAHEAKRALELGNSMFASGRFAEALDAYDDAIQMLHTLYAHRLDAYLSKGVLDVPEEYVSAWISKGTTLSRLGKYRKALAHFDIALTLEPKNKFAMNNRGDALVRLGRLEEGRECFMRALEIDGEFADAERNLAEVEKLFVQSDRAMQSNALSQLPQSLNQ